MYPASPKFYTQEKPQADNKNIIVRKDGGCSYLFCMPAYEYNDIPYDLVSGTACVNAPVWGLADDTILGVKDQPHLVFDGSHCIDFGVINPLAGISNAFSFIIDFKLTVKNVRQSLASCWTISPIEASWDLYIDTDNYLKFDYRSADNTTTYVCASTSGAYDININYKMVMSSYQNSTSTSRIWQSAIYGVYAASDNTRPTIAAFPLRTSTSRLLIGAKAATTTTQQNYLNGIIRSVSIVDYCMIESTGYCYETTNFFLNPYCMLQDSRPVNYLNEYTKDFQTYTYVSGVKHKILPQWAVTHAYYLNDKVIIDDGTVFNCIKAGTSGSSNSVFKLGRRRISYDGTVIWQECGGKTWDTALGSSVVLSARPSGEIVYVDADGYGSAGLGLLSYPVSSGNGYSYAPRCMISVDSSSGQPPTVEKMISYSNYTSMQGVSVRQTYAKGLSFGVALDFVCFENHYLKYADAPSTSYLLAGMTNNITSSVTPRQLVLLNCGDSSGYVSGMTASTYQYFKSGQIDVYGGYINTAGWVALRYLNARVSAAIITFPNDDVTTSKKFRIEARWGQGARIDFVGCHFHKNNCLVDRTYDEVLAWMDSNAFVSDSQFVSLKINKRYSQRLDITNDNFKATYVPWNLDWDSNGMNTAMRPLLGRAGAVSSRGKQVESFEMVNNTTPGVYTGYCYLGWDFCNGHMDDDIYTITKWNTLTGVTKFRVYFMVQSAYVTNSVNFELIYPSDVSSCKYSVVSSRGAQYINNTQTKTTVSESLWDYYEYPGGSNVTGSFLASNNSYHAYYIELSVDIKKPGLIRLNVKVATNNTNIIVVSPYIEITQ